MPDDSADGVGGRPDSVEPRSRSNRTVTPAIAAALVVLAASFALSVAFVLANGGLDLPAAQRPSSSAVSSAALAEGSSPPASSAPSASAPVAATPEPTPAPTAKPSPSARSTPAATPGSSSSRYTLLTACPDEPECWIYVVRQGDNLFSIARYFGVPLSTVEARNPWTRDTQLVAGQKLRLPPPTR